MAKSNLRRSLARRRLRRMIEACYKLITLHGLCVLDFEAKRIGMRCVGSKHFWRFDGTSRGRSI